MTRPALLALGLLALHATAGALDLTALQRLLQSAPVQTVGFSELRESPWLAAPIESRGTLRAGPDSLEKHVESPREETWRLLSDRMEWVGPRGEGAKHVPFSRAPAVGALAQALRAALAGELLPLERDFQLALRGDAAQWSLELVPRDAATARRIEQLELHGEGPRLRRIVVIERQGERTTTSLNP